VKVLRLSAIWAALALGVGLFVLLGYFVDLGFIQNFRLTFLRWAVLLAAAALVVGLANLLAVHWRKVSLTEAGWIYSGVLILSFTVTLVLALVFRPDGQAALFIFNTFQLPLESSLMAVLAVSLLVAGFRLVNRRRDLLSLLFVGTALMVLLGTGPAPGGAEGPVVIALRDFRAWLSQVWAAGGARGILLGVALGATATGLRVLLAADRPYGS
jgi:hypothetical protein